MELTQKQIYAYWIHLHEEIWRLHDDQVKSALQVLEKYKEEEVEIIPMPSEDGISTIAFTFKEVLDKYSEHILEVAMDSTCKRFNFKLVKP
jgi:hypothetical protein